MTASIFSPVLSPAWLWFWEMLEFASIIIVGVGCWGEVWSEHHKFSDNPNDLLSGRKNKFWMRFFWLMVVWGLALELVAFGFSFLASNQELEGLKLKTEELRKQNDALEAEIQPRRITPEQKAAIIRDLYEWRFIKDRCEVHVKVEGYDTEARIFAEQISHVLSDNVGFKVNLFEGIDASPPSGFGTKFSAHDPPPDGARAIAQALKILPINPINGEISTNIPNGVLEIEILPKPIE